MALQRATDQPKATTASPTSGDVSDDPNLHVREYVEHYLRFPHAPHFAVLLDGLWGVGKTHLLRTFLTRSMPDAKVAYVSLYGLTSKADIEEAVFAAVYPRATGKAARIAGGVAKALLRHAKYEIDFEKSDVLNRFAADVYVFDDLERTGMPIDTALGYINEFVEHDGCKVVIVANVVEIPETQREEFHRRREKLVGKVLAVRSAFGEAFEWFATKVDDEGAREFLRQHAQEISAIYDQSGLANLRILQQTMWDFARVHACLDERQRGNGAGLLVLLRLFFAMSFEVKSGRLRAADLHDRMSGVMTGLFGEKREPSPIRTANDRYRGIELYEPVLDDDVLEALLIVGSVDADAIRQSLDRSAHFSAGEEAAWRVVWSAFERDDEEVERAIAEMNAKLAAGDYTQAGEILHIVGLQLHLSDIGQSGLSRAQVLDNAKACIADLRRRGTLELPRDSWNDDLRFGGYGGLGLTQSDSAEMTELFSYLSTERAAAASDLRPGLAVALLEEMTSDPDLFVRRITQSKTPDSLYVRVPILAAMDVTDFLKAFLALHPTGQRTVSQGLQWRYEESGLSGEFASERAWLEDVRNGLLAAAAAAAPLTRDRLRKNVRWTFDKILDLESTP